MIHSLRPFDRYPRPTRFGNAAASTIKALGHEPIQNLGIANRLFKVFKNTDKPFKFGNLSLEEVAGRLYTLIAMYIPQTIIAFREDMHKWETVGRNAMAWVLAIVVASLMKHDKYGINAWFKHFMKPVLPPEQLSQEVTKLKAAGGLKGALGAWFKQKINPHLLPVDYFEILKASGVQFREDARKKAHYVNLDRNEVDLVIKKLDELKFKEKAGEALSEAEEKMVKTIPTFLRRKNVFLWSALAAQSVLMSYFIGRVALDFIFAFVAPFDHDFNADKYNGYWKDRAKRISREKAASRPASNSMFRQLAQSPPLLHNQSAFQRFKTTAATGGPTA